MADAVVVRRSCAEVLLDRVWGSRGTPWPKGNLMGGNAFVVVAVLWNCRTGIGAVPIVDDEGRVVGIYSRSDITFLATAADPEAVLQVSRALATW